MNQSLAENSSVEPSGKTTIVSGVPYVTIYGGHHRDHSTNNVLFDSQVMRKYRVTYTV